VDFLYKFNNYYVMIDIDEDVIARNSKKL